METKINMHTKIIVKEELKKEKTSRIKDQGRSIRIFNSRNLKMVIRQGSLMRVL